MPQFALLRLIRRWMLWHVSGIRYFFYASNQNLVVVTGANHNHFKSLKQFVASAIKYEPFSKVIIFDLGLTASQSAEIRRLIETNPLVEIREFLFKNYPPHLNIEVNAGEYAWKPVIIGEICSESDGFVLWCDSGNVIDKRLSWIRRIVQRDGIYCPFSAGTIAEWTHPGMLSFLKLDDRYKGLQNLNAAVICLNPRNPEISKLIIDWHNCALNVNCISPKGSSRANHRQDQAALTSIAVRNGVIKATRPKYVNQLWEPLGLRIQCDVDSE